VSAAVRFRRTGRVVFIVGKVPEKAGDRFEASDDPPEIAPARKAGCTLGENPDGSRFFSCSRGRSPSAPPRAWPKPYLFSPDIHALIPLPLARGEGLAQPR